MPLMESAEVSPLLSPSFAGVPSAFVVSVGHDPLRDDALLYVQRLRESGQVATVEHRHFPNKYHAFFTIHPAPIVEAITDFFKKHPFIL